MAFVPTSSNPGIVHNSLIFSYLSSFNIQPVLTSRLPLVETGVTSGFYLLILQSLVVFSTKQRQVGNVCKADASQREA